MCVLLHAKPLFLTLESDLDLVSGAPDHPHQKRKRKGSHARNTSVSPKCCRSRTTALNEGRNRRPPVCQCAPVLENEKKVLRFCTKCACTFFCFCKQRQKRAFLSQNFIEVREHPAEAGPRGARPLRPPSSGRRTGWSATGRAATPVPPERCPGQSLRGCSWSSSSR